MKNCRKCLINKEETSFYKSKANKDGLSSYCSDCSCLLRKTWASKNKNKVAEANKEYRERNKTRLLEYYRKWKTTEKGQASRRDGKKKYKASGLGKEASSRRYRKYILTEKGKEAYKRATLKWRSTEEYKIKSRIAAKNRKAKLKQAEGSFLASDISVLLTYCSYKCEYCAVPVSDSYHVDHIVPIVSGGSNYPQNLAIACPSCNLHKGKKPLASFHPEKEQYFLERNNKLYGGHSNECTK